MGVGSVTADSCADLLKNSHAAFDAGTYLPGLGHPVVIEIRQVPAPRGTGVEADRGRIEWSLQKLLRLELGEPRVERAGQEPGR